MRIGSSEFVVVDASVAVKLLVEEENSEVAVATVRSWHDAGVQFAAPSLMPYEVSNALYRKVAAGEMTFDMAEALMQILMSHGFELYGESESRRVAFELASRFSQRAVYDSYYLALALALDCDFWTADERFYRSVADDLPNVRLISEATTPNQ